MLKTTLLPNTAARGLKALQIWKRVACCHFSSGWYAAALSRSWMGWHCFAASYLCFALQEAPMLYCGEEIGTGADPKVSL